MISSISCPVCQNLCSSQAASCPKCGHPFKKEDAPIPSFLGDAAEIAPAQPFFIIIFRILATISLIIGILFGITLVIAPFTNPQFGEKWLGVFIKFFLGMLFYAFFSFLISVSKRK